MQDQQDNNAKKLPQEGMGDMKGMGQMNHPMPMAHSAPNLGLTPIEPSHVIKVGTDVDWNGATGFGNMAGKVAMMNRMMIAGDGMEGMKMKPMAMDFGPDSFAPEGEVVPVKKAPMS